MRHEHRREGFEDSGSAELKPITTSRMVRPETRAVDPGCGSLVISGFGVEVGTTAGWECVRE